MKESPLKPFKKEIIKLYESNMSFHAIARELNTTHGAIIKLIQNDVVKRPKSLAYTVDSKIIAQRYKSGESYRSIASSYKCSVSTVKRILSKHMDINTNYKYEDLIDFFKEDYKKGLSFSDIGKKYGVSRSTVNEYLNLEKERIRTFEESNRKDNLDFDYFKLDNLNKDKLATLSLIYNKFRFYESSRVKIVGLISDFEYIFDNVISKFSSSKVYQEGPNATFCYEINSKAFYNNLMYTLKNILKSEHKNSFMKCMVENKLYVNKVNISLRCTNLDNEDILDYLTDLGIERKSISFSRNCPSIYIQEINTINRLIKTYPSIADKIKNSEFKDLPKWKKLMKQSEIKNKFLSKI